MNVLSLFDGMSCGQIALERAGIKVDKYFASEIDKYAIKVTMSNYPQTIQLGDIKNVHYTNLGLEVDLSYSKTQCYSGKIDLIIGGSPCQGFSIAGKQLNFKDERSKLFFEYVILLKEVRETNADVYFLFENVKMKKEHELVINNLLETKPLRFNSKWVSAQNRERLYWTNIPVNSIPTDKNIMLKDIIESGEVDRDKSYCIDANYYKGGSIENYIDKARRQIVMHQSEKSLMVAEATKKGFAEINVNEGIDLTFPTSKTRRGRRMEDKSNALTAATYDFAWYNGCTIRKLTPIECERLQTVPDTPDNYTNYVSSTQRYKMLGNGWTVDIITHILNHIPKPIL